MGSPRGLSRVVRPVLLRHRVGRGPGVSNQAPRKVHEGRHKVQDQRRVNVWWGSIQGEARGRGWLRGLVNWRNSRPRGHCGGGFRGSALLFEEATMRGHCNKGAWRPIKNHWDVWRIVLPMGAFWIGDRSSRFFSASADCSKCFRRGGRMRASGIKSAMARPTSFQKIAPAFDRTFF